MDTQSDKVDKITISLLQARGQMDGAVKSAKGNWGHYASLEDLLECSMSHLIENNIILTQPTVAMDGKNFVCTQLTHISGQWMRGFTEMVIAKENDPQKALGGQTYARRGGIESMLSIPRVDDDGEYGNGGKPKPIPKAKPTPKPNAKEFAGILTLNGEGRFQEEWNEPMPDDIPFDGIDELLTENQRKALVKQAKTLGVPVQDVVGLIKGMGYKTSADIPQSKYGLLKSMIGNLVARGEDE